MNHNKVIRISDEDERRTLKAMIRHGYRATDGFSDFDRDARKYFIAFLNSQSKQAPQEPSDSPASQGFQTAQ